MRVGEWRIGRGYGMVQEARGYDRAMEGRECEGRVGCMRRLGRRRKESGEEGCGVERRDAIVVYGTGGVVRVGKRRVE